MNNEIELKGKIYIVSDSHLGVPNREKSLERERMLVNWLDEIKEQATALILLGDIFDFWFEYRYVVPRGYIRLMGKLADLADHGVRMFYFTGNHDMWIKDYFAEELNMEIFRKEQIFRFNGERCFVAHGDGLGRKDYGYKFIKRVFACKFNQFLFRCLHPGMAFRIALFCSKSSRVANGNSDEIFLGEDNERLVQYCRDKEKNDHFDFYIFGHRHLPLDIKINDTCRYLNSGEWIRNFSYIEADENAIQLKYYAPTTEACNEDENMLP